ncbi:DUF3566 domain-containing protein [Mycobacterium sp. CPCC 205372]|uniref:DUF3566 domain-containing protein n=1 Tax=Mycobacterium hippophais TaxID=3016340 RepID=A0ABT4PUX4_9MYCO|nr:DUF3566 domain-containing protein [Mycobacterium hippophais]MCZ8380301.1 DUF3566 domain-containing protein [Mycobacterium hippophais]
MSSPNEPGYPRAGDGPSVSNGSAAGRDGGALGAAAGRTGSPAGHAAEHGEVPPWQRSRARPPRPQGEAPVRTDGPRGPEGPVRTDGPRGTDAPTRTESVTPPPARAPERADAGRSESRSEAYASELPDLSGPVPRPPQRRTGTDRPAEPAPRTSAPTSRVHVGSSKPKGPVRATMQIRRVDPWSALKVSLVLSVALFFVWMIAVAFLYLVLGGMGVWSKLNSNVGDLLTSASGSTGDELVSSSTIFGGAALIGLVNIVILSAMATAGAFIYNLTTDLVGGVEVTLADRD